MLLTEIAGGRIYYVVSYDGLCSIREIRIKGNDNVHVNVFEIKSRTCKGFTNKGSIFYFIDEYNTIIKLQRNKSSGQFEEITTLNIKVMDRPNFVLHPFSRLIIDDRYLINESRIFYL